MQMRLIRIWTPSQVRGWQTQKRVSSLFFRQTIRNSKNPLCRSRPARVKPLHFPNARAREKNGLIGKRWTRDLLYPQQSVQIAYKRSDCTRQKTIVSSLPVPLFSTENASITSLSVRLAPLHELIIGSPF